jgi:Transglycosylase SLT domain
MFYIRSWIIVLLSQAIIMTAVAGERTTWRNVAFSTQKYAGRHATQNASKRTATPLDRVAIAVDGAESSHGKDLDMWRPDPSGPQGPMQVSEGAAMDVGGGDRFDLTQNRAIGRAYLAQLYGRYRNWPDAIAAYNWGLGKMDAWVKAGRPPDKFLVGVAIYLRRVLRDSGLCNSTEPKRLQQWPVTADRSDARREISDQSNISACAYLDSGSSFKDLAKDSLGALKLGTGQPRSRLEREVAKARSSWITAMRAFSGCTPMSEKSFRCR